MEDKNMLCWGKGYAFVFTENERLWIHLRLTEIRFDQETPPESPGYRNKAINLEKLQDWWHMLSMLKHRTNCLGLDCVQWQSMLMLIQIYMLPLKIYVFSEQGDQIPIKSGVPSDPASQSASVAISSEFCIQNSFTGCWLRWFNLTDYSSQDLILS